MVSTTIDSIEWFVLFKLSDILFSLPLYRPFPLLAFCFTQKVVSLSMLTLSAPLWLLQNLSKSVLSLQRSKFDVAFASSGPISSLVLFSDEITVCLYSLWLKSSLNSSISKPSNIMSLLSSFELLSKVILPISPHMQLQDLLFGSYGSSWSVTI